MRFFLAVIIGVALFSSAAFSAGYSCPAYQKYTSCNSGYYMTTGGNYNGTPVSGNSCSSCPTGYSCAGGTAAPALLCSSNCAVSQTQSCTTSCGVGYNAVAGTQTRPCNLSGDGCSYYGDWGACSAYCAPVTINCPAGQFMWWWAGDGRLHCEPCHNTYYCPGGTNVFGSGAANIANSSGVVAIYSCPAGYTSTSGKSTATQCYKSCSLSPAADGNITSISYATQVNYPSACPTTYTITGCAAGYYLANAGDQKCTAVGSGYYSPAGSISTFGCPATESWDNGYLIVSNGGAILSDAGAGAATDCYLARNGSDWWQFEKENKGYWGSDGKCYYGASKRYNNCTSPKRFSECFAGYYINNSVSAGPGFANSCSPCAAGTYTVALHSQELIGIPTTYHYATSCTPCSANTYSTVPIAASASVCQTCPSGGMSPAGSDEAADCGHRLHVGSGALYLRSAKKTTPSLNISINGQVFYGNMTTATKGTLRVNSGGTKYSVYDDSI